MTAPSPRVRALLAEHARLALDSNALIYLLEDATLLAEPVAEIVDAAERGEVELVAATLSLTEILAGPARSGDPLEVERLATALMELPLRWIDLDPTVASAAANIRGAGGVPLGDAILLATALEAGATAFVTNDRRIPTHPDLKVVILDTLVEGT